MDMELKKYQEKVICARWLALGHTKKWLPNNVMACKRLLLYYNETYNIEV